MKFKVGDKVKLKGTKSSGCSWEEAGELLGCSWEEAEQFFPNLVGTIYDIYDGDIWVKWKSGAGWIFLKFLEKDLLPYKKETILISSNKQISLKNKIMDLKEKFLLSITKEPQKTFRKTGITNGDDLLTDDGKEIFINWLFQKNKDEFKKEVVDDLLKEKEEE